MYKVSKLAPPPPKLFQSLREAVKNYLADFLVTQHIPTMTNSHHGGFLSMMIMAGICQWQNPTIGDDEQISCSGSFFAKVL